MRFILEITSEMSVGKKLWLRARQTADVGRGDHAVFGVPHDQQMSALHFHIACDDHQCKLRDLNSRNGTTVNGKKVVQSVLNDGDSIVAGETHFRVRIGGADSDEPATDAGDFTATRTAPPADGPLQRVGHWICGPVPGGWEIVPEKGMRSTGDDQFPTNLIFTESAATEGVSLEQHVETLIEMYLKAIPGTRTDGATAMEIPGGEEARQFLLEHPQLGDVAIWQRYVCVRQGDSIGMAVLTTSRDELQQSGALIDRMLAELAWEA